MSKFAVIPPMVSRLNARTKAEGATVEAEGATVEMEAEVDVQLNLSKILVEESREGLPSASTADPLLDANKNQWAQMSKAIAAKGRYRARKVVNRVRNYCKKLKGLNVSATATANAGQPGEEGSGSTTASWPVESGRNLSK